MSYMYNVRCNVNLVRSCLLLFCTETQLHLFCKWKPVTFIIIFRKSVLSSVVTKNYKYFLWLLSMQLYKCVDGIENFTTHYASFKTFIFLWCIPFIPVYISTLGFLVWGGMVLEFGLVSFLMKVDNIFFSTNKLVLLQANF